MTYICADNRHHIFSTPESWIEPHGEEMTGCPICGQGGYEEAEPCRMCGEYTPLDELKRTDGLCAECLVDFDKEIDDADNV